MVLTDGEGNFTDITSFVRLVNRAKKFTDAPAGSEKKEEILPIPEPTPKKPKILNIHAPQHTIISGVVIDSPHTQKLLQNVHDFLHDLQLRVSYPQEITLDTYEKFLRLLSSKSPEAGDDIFPFVFSLVISSLRLTLQEAGYDSKFPAYIPIDAFLSYFNSQFVRDILYPHLACLKKTETWWIEEDESKFVNLLAFQNGLEKPSKSLWKEESAPSIMIYHALMAYKKDIIASAKKEVPKPIFRFSLDEVQQNQR